MTFETQPVRHIVAEARRHNATVEQLQYCLPSLPDWQAVALLNGSAIISEDDGHGKYTVHFPSSWRFTQ